MYLTGAPLGSVGIPGQVDSAARVALGTRCFGVDPLGNTAEFIYLQGVASTIAGSVVTFDEAGQTLLIAAGAVGPVAVALGIVTAGLFGWYGIAGTFPTDVVANCADNAAIGRETTDGKVGDGAASGNFIFGAVSRAATTAAAVVNCQFLYGTVNGKSA
jgi:hypothetical protein